MEIVYYVASSLDGHIATADGGVEWLSDFQGDEDYGYGEFYASVDALMMGSYTYEVSLGFGEWPSPDKPTWVFTSRDLPVAHPTITMTSEEPADVVESLAAEGVQRAWLMGGGKLASSFLARDLLSELRLFVIPVVLGAGIPVFADPSPITPMHLGDTRHFENGVVELRYRRESPNG